MTGFGSAEHSEDGVSYALEIRSLNHRYFKATIKLPEHLQRIEAEVEKVLRRRIQRGSVMYMLRLRNSGASAAYEVNTAALEYYLTNVKEAATHSGVAPTIEMGSVLMLPGICHPPRVDEQALEHDTQIMVRVTESALDQLVEMRKREGRSLEADLLEHCRQLRATVQRVAARAPQVMQDYQKKLRDRVASLVADASLAVDSDLLLREVAIYADRCDISEEIARLSAHLDQFQELCADNEHTGRKLDFLTQEMLRETNTIGSKSNDAMIARCVVEMKGSIDRLKEQVQNVE